MADFAPNFTARLRLRYSTLSKTHSLMWRAVNTVTDPSGLISKLGLFLGDLEPLLYDDWTILGTDFALADSDVFLPVANPTAPTGAFSSAAAPRAAAAIPISFVSRSTAGGKGRFFLYGTGLAQTLFDATEGDYRISSAEDANISAAIVRLNETSPALVCNDNHTAIWYEYVNIKPNDNWVRKQRRG